MVVMGAEKAKQVPITSKEADFVILNDADLGTDFGEVGVAAGN